MSKPIVYVDLDGVMADYAKATGNYQEPGFFKNLEPIKNAVYSFSILSRYYDMYLLSTAPWSSPVAWMEKRQWVESHLGLFGFKRLILSHHKHLLAGDYLIDDRTENGAGQFKGEFIHFGSDRFLNWDVVTAYLLDKVIINKPVIDHEN